MTLAAAVPGSLYEGPAYLRVAAAALGAEVELAEFAGAILPMFACPDGVMRTAPGLPRPYGPNLAGGLAELAYELTEPLLRIDATLSPLQSGPDLARELAVRGARLVAERQMCVIELADGDPDLWLHSDTRREVTSPSTDNQVEVSQLDERFHEFHRSPKRGAGFAQTSVLTDEHLEPLSECEHYVISVTDRHGIAAAALFLHDGRESYCHSGSIRGEPPAGDGVVRLALVAGVCEAARLGCRIVVLGGGMSDRLDDPLLALKLGLATTVLPRFTLTTDGIG